MLKPKNQATHKVMSDTKEIENNSENGQAKTRVKRKSYSGFETYIKRVQMKVHPDLQIIKTTLGQLSELAVILVKNFGRIALDAKNRQNKKTITPREIEYAVNVSLEKDLALHARVEGEKAVERYKTVAETVDKPVDGKKKPQPLQVKAGLIVSVSRCVNYLREFNSRIGVSAAIYMAAVIEFIMSEILELAGIVTKGNEAVKIKSRDVFFAIENDDELKSLASKLNIEFGEAGVLPKIRPELLPDEGIKKKNAAARRKHGKDAPKEKVHKFLPGTVSLREIKKYQKGTELLMTKSHFRRNIKSFLREYSTDEENTSFSRGVWLSLQDFVELRLVKIFDESQERAIKAKRQAVTGKDIQKAQQSLLECKLGSSNREAEKTGYIMPILDPSVRRMARRGGVKRLNKGVYAEINHVAAYLMYKIAEKINWECKLQRCKTVSPKILRSALANMGYNFIFST